MKSPESLGNNIRMWLKLKGMKQGTLARKMNVEPSYISQLLSGKPEILEKRKMEIAKHLEVDPEQLDRVIPIIPNPYPHWVTRCEQL